MCIIRHIKHVLAGKNGGILIGIICAITGHNDSDTNEMDSTPII
jgi:hypothetical protein